jgi:tetratricopeptide (TPR) repeat protein
VTTHTPTTRDEFFQALRENRERPKGRATAAVAEELVDAAEAFGDDEVTVSTLVELMRAYHGSGEAVKYPVTFARLLQLWDANPKAFDEWETHQLFWYFKWVTSGLLVTPDVPLASIRGWIAEMRRRYEAAGHGLQPVYGEEYQLASHLGENELLAYELWATRGRTDLSDCAACEARERGDHHFRHGEDERGLAELRPTFEGRHSCDAEPHSSQALALLPLLRLGRYDEARAMHLAAYRKVRGKESELTDIGRHLEFCALTGNEARGLELLAQNRDSFGFTASPSGRLEFLTGVEVLLARLEATGHGSLPCAGPLGAEWTVASLRAAVTAQADELAARFDARNGNAAVSGRRRERLERRPLVAQLNLGVQTAVLAGPSAAARQGDASSGGASPGGASAGVSLVQGAALDAAGDCERESEPEPELPETPEELFAEIRRLARIRHPRERALWDTLIERAESLGENAADGEGGDLGDLVRGGVAMELSHRAVRRGDWDTAAARLDEAVECYGRAGLEGRRIAAESRAAWCTVARAEPADTVAAAEAAWPAFEGLLARIDGLLASDLDGGLRTDALYRKLIVRQSRVMSSWLAAVRAGDPEQRSHWRAVLFAEAGAVIAEGSAEGVWAKVAVVHEVLAEFQAQHGEATEAEASARRAIAVYEEQAWPWRLPQARQVLALTLGVQKRHAEAMAELERGIAEAPSVVPAEELTPLHRMLGGLALSARQFATAVRALSEAAARLDREGKPRDARETRLRLAHALSAQGSLGDAVAVLESLVEPSALVVPAAKPAEPAESGESGSEGGGAPSPDEQLTAQIRGDLAAALMEMDEPRDAAVQFLQLADLVSRWPAKNSLTAAAAGAAHALALAGNWDGARAAIERALEANREAPRLFELNEALRALALAAVEARGKDALPEALDYVDQADRVREEFPEAAREQFRSVDVDLAQCRYTRGRVLAVTGKPEEALAAFEEAVAVYDGAGWAKVPPRFEVVRLAALVEARSLDRADAARARLDRAASEADTAGLPEAASTLRRLRSSLQ